MTASEFYQSHLDRVSRSFAFCIGQLPTPLQEWIGLSYLLCRVVDTIEDSAWESLAAQLEMFQIFDRSLQSSAGVSPLKNWLKDFPPNLPEGERLLIADSARLLEDFHQLPPQVHEIIAELVLSMSLGMQHFCSQRREGALRLRTLHEVNQYCFFVAGLVGELLAKLLARVEPAFALSPAVLLRAHHFGLFLQKVNLLKDQVGDEKVGRHLIPSREAVENSAQENATHAFEFLLNVPAPQIEFRRFCAWSLFLGLESLSVARTSVEQRRVLKVARADAETLIAAVEASLSDDATLRTLFAEGLHKLGWPKPDLKSEEPHEFPHWLLSLYRGPLDAQKLKHLGV